MQFLPQVYGVFDCKGRAQGTPLLFGGSLKRELLYPQFWCNTLRQRKTSLLGLPLQNTPISGKDKPDVLALQMSRPIKTSARVPLNFPRNISFFWGGSQLATYSPRTSRVQPRLCVHHTDPPKRSNFRGPGTREPQFPRSHKEGPVFLVAPSHPLSLLALAF